MRYPVRRIAYRHRDVGHLHSLPGGIYQYLQFEFIASGELPGKVDAAERIEPVPRLGILEADTRLQPETEIGEFIGESVPSRHSISIEVSRPDNQSPRHFLQGLREACDV